MADERVAVVTGTTSGIGKEVARALARDGFTVVMHGRDAAKLAVGVEDVRRSAPAARIETARADLADPAQVEALAADLAARFPKIDVLVNNAAIVPHTRRAPHGVEETFAVNVLAIHVLVDRLADRLEGGRVVTFYGGQGTNDLLLDDLQTERKAYDGWDAYTRSKNALGAWSIEAAKRRPGVQFLTVLPGLVNTEGMRGLPGRMIWFSRLAGWLMRTPEQGARTPVWAATAPELAGVSGRFYGNLAGSGWRNELKVPPVVTDPASGRAVWEACAGLDRGAVRAAG